MRVPSHARAARHSRSTVVFDTPMVGSDTRFAAAALAEEEHAKDILDLYQLSITLLGCREQDDALNVSLELLKEWSRASVVGFLWVDDEGQLKPKRVLPGDAEVGARFVVSPNII